MFQTPARQRFSQSRAPSSVPSARRTSQQRIEIPELPPYEAPAAPLSLETQRLLAKVLESGEYRDLKINLDHAVKTLTESAGEVNERLTDARVRYEKNKERRRKRDASEEQNDEDDEGDDDTGVADQELLGEFERRAEAVTDQMEQSLRTVIDSEMRLRGLHDSVERVSKEEEAAVARATAASLAPRQTRAQRREDRDDDDGEDGAEDDDPQDEDFEDGQEQEAREQNARNPPSRRYKVAFQKGVEGWNGMSLTERYSNNNNYIGFYRMVHDAKFPNNEAPPLPHSSTWFSHLEDRNAGTGASSSGQRSTRNRRETSDSDDDIAIAREKVSLKCPITLQTFRDPVTSGKCRHTFERSAIEGLILGSVITHPPASGGRRVQAVRCPECSTINTKEDFRPDPVILRRVKRAEEEEARRAEEQFEGESQMTAPNHITLRSDGVDPDEMDVDVDMDGTPAPSARIKSEPMERRRQRQPSTDNEESEENDMDMDEEEEDMEDDMDDMDSEGESD